MNAESRQCCFLLLAFSSLGKWRDIWRLMATMGNDSEAACVTPHVGHGIEREGGRKMISVHTTAGSDAK